MINFRIYDITFESMGMQRMDPGADSKAGHSRRSGLNHQHLAGLSDVDIREVTCGADLELPAEAAASGPRPTPALFAMSSREMSDALF